jgi:hypothetical protein
MPLFWELTEETKMQSNLLSLQALKDNLQRGTVNTVRQELHCVSRKTFRIFEACLEAGSQHFKTTMK